VKTGLIARAKPAKNAKNGSGESRPKCKTTKDGSFTAVAFNGAQMLVVMVLDFVGVIFMLMDPRPILKGGKP